MTKIAAGSDHQARLSDAQGNKLGEQTFKHGGEGLAQLANWILQLTAAAPDAVHIAIEVAQGPVAESLG